MTIPQLYRKTPEVQKTVDFIELATGVAQKIFYTQQSWTTAAIWILNPVVQYSNKVAEDDNSITQDATFNEVFNRDADITFKSTLVIEGDLAFSIPLGVGHGGGAGGVEVKAAITVYHYDGSTETQLATGTTDVVSASGAGIFSSVRSLLLNVPSTRFRPGDTLRVTYSILGSANATVTDAAVGWAFDPQNRDGSGDAPNTFDSSAVTLNTVTVPIKGAI